jgi:hypothetical protein
MALWRFSEAVWGQAGPDGDKATKRLNSLGRGIFYAVVCASTVAFTIGAGGPGSSDKKSKDYSGKAMHDIPGGRWLVLLVGLKFDPGKAKGVDGRCAVPSRGTGPRPSHAPAAIRHLVTLGGASGRGRARRGPAWPAAAGSTGSARSPCDRPTPAVRPPDSAYSPYGLPVP